LNALSSGYFLPEPAAEFRVIGEFPADHFDRHGPAAPGEGEVIGLPVRPSIQRLTASRATARASPAGRGIIATADDLPSLVVIRLAVPERVPESLPCPSHVLAGWRVSTSEGPDDGG
jgi:hypothetical protein